MPNVTSQNLFAVLPSMINIIRGQATSAKVTLHKNYVGNSLPIALQKDVKVEYIDGNNLVFKTESVSAQNLIFGTGELNNQMSIEVTAQESAALNLSEAGISGELYVRITVTLAADTVVLPKLKIGNVFDAGDQIGEIVASRFTVPSTVYKIKALDNYANTNPGAGEMVFNSITPSQVTMVKVSNQDDKGFKNQWLESVLADRIGVDGLTNSIFFTNVNNTSEYSLYRISSYSRINTNANANDDDLADAIQLGLIYEGNSSSAGDNYLFEVGDSYGIFTESYQGLLSQGIHITTPSHLNGVDGVRELTFTGTSVTSTVGAQATDGLMTIDIAPGQKGEKGEIGDKGAKGEVGVKGEQGIKGETGSKGDEGSTAYEVYADSMPNPLGESDWLNSLIGAKGDDGLVGQKGDDGSTAYEVYADSMQNPLNEVDWLNSLVGPIGQSGEKGSSGSKGEEGTKGEEGAKGDLGQKGAEGVSNIPGPDGLAGEPGQKGERGFHGHDGQKGEQGDKGADSQVAGPDGAKGEPGQKGEIGAGTPGEKGATGTGAPGQTGSPGTPGGAGTPGDKGAPGDKGQKGQIGTGSPGQTGQKGESGQGDKGEPGIGEKGEKGQTGDIGQKGAVGTGSPGQTGPDGTPGTPGTPGLKGQKGQTGADSQVAGVKGEKGDTGNKGEKGQGIKGDKGDDGSTAYEVYADSMQNPLNESDWLNSLIGGQGPKGEDSQVAGPKGDDGDPGAKGEPSQVAGPDGQKGEVGVKGEQGIKGETGSKGADSQVAGPKGNTGEKGAKGIQGSTGTGITMQGSVADVTALNALPGPHAQGDAYIVQFDDSLHIWDGAQFTSGGSIQGPEGPTGPQGQLGPKGNTGDPGAKGEPSQVAGPDGQKGEVGVGQKGQKGADSQVAGPDGQKGEVGAGQKGNTGEKGAKGAGGGGGGATKYLLRLEYDLAENLIVPNTSFVTATGFTTAGANIVSQVAGGGALGHTVTLNFGETNPPVSVMGYAWNPQTANYTVVHYDRDQKQIQYEVGISAFTNQSTVDGGSGEAGQWAGDVFSGAGNYNITIDVDQQALPYGNAVPGGFGAPDKLPHCYLVLTF